MSGDPEQEYFADGLMEDIITALSRFKLRALLIKMYLLASPDRYFSGIASHR